MSTVTFESGVHLGTRNDAADFIDWFDASPTTQFSPITVAVSSVQVLTSVEGRLGDGDPVLVQFGGGGLPSAYDALSAVAARGVLNGAPRKTLSGFRDAVIQSGFLLKMSMRLEWDSDARSEWGILTNLRNTVQGGQRGWRLSAVFHPCCAVAYTGLGSWVLNPVCFAELGGGAE